MLRQNRSAQSPVSDEALFAGYHPHLEVIGISTVAANQTVEKVTKNALEILSVAGLDRIGKAASFWGFNPPYQEQFVFVMGSYFQEQQS